jgi:hypothetical protein
MFVQDLMPEEPPQAGEDPAWSPWQTISRLYEHLAHVCAALCLNSIAALFYALSAQSVMYLPPEQVLEVSFESFVVWLNHSLAVLCKSSFYCCRYEELFHHASFFEFSPPSWVSNNKDTHSGNGPLQDQLDPLQPGTAPLTVSRYLASTLNHLATELITAADFPAALRALVFSRKV